jgi:hypothetical protein
MQTRIDEIAAGLSIFVPEVAIAAGFTFNHFLILDDESAEVPRWRKARERGRLTAHLSGQSATRWEAAGVDCQEDEREKFTPVNLHPFQFPFEL